MFFRVSSLSNHELSLGVLMCSPVSISTRRPQIQVNNEILQQFVEVEFAIAEHEKKNVMDNYQAKTESMDQLEQAMMQLAKIKEQCHEEA